MAEKMMFSYDKEGDVLDISINRKFFVDKRNGFCAGEKNKGQSV